MLSRPAVCTAKDAYPSYTGTHALIIAWLFNLPLILVRYYGRILLHKKIGEKMLKLPTLSLSLCSLIFVGLTATTSYAQDSICIKADTYYRLNYVPGGSAGTTIHPGQSLVLAHSGDAIADWSGKDIGTVPNVSAAQYLNITGNTLSIAPLTGSCQGGAGPQPTPGSEGNPTIPSGFVLSTADDSSSRAPSIGKEYVKIDYSMWWGYQAHYLDVTQDGQKICLAALDPKGGTTPIPTTCNHSYTFPNYSSGSQEQQVTTLEFGPTTITKHKYSVVFSNDKGQTTKDYDVDLAGATGLTSAITVTADPQSQGKATADTSAQKTPNIALTAANVSFKFTITDSTLPTASTYTLAWSNPGLFTDAPRTTDTTGSFAITPKSLTPGRSSLRITDSNGNVRYIGFTIVDRKFNTKPMSFTPSQRLNAALPNYVAIGSVTEDNSDAINYWRHFNSDSPDQNRRVDIRYIYLNQWSNGNEQGWAPREASFLQNGLELGQMPFFVEYNVNGGQDNQQHVRDNLQNKAFMGSYFLHLAKAAQIAHAQAGNTPVGFIIEPDMLGYMLHDLKEPVNMPAALDALYTTPAPIDPSSINVPYSQQQNIPKARMLVNKTKHNFPNTLQGFVQAVNYVLWKYSNGTAVVGWQMNLWASPDNNGTGIIHKDPATVINNAKILAQQGQAVGIRPSATPALWDNSFISIDKYGLDGAGYQPGDADKPAESSWFWNADLYDNYLAFASTLAYPNVAGVTNLPIVLWQLPVGHLNGSRTNSPYTGVPFANLQDVSTQYEGSSAPYFLGEDFTIGKQTNPRTAASDEKTTCIINQQEMPYFACPDHENGVTVKGSAVTWNSHMTHAAQDHVIAILFGAGVGASTHSNPQGAATAVTDKTSDPDTYMTTPDDNWFIYQVQQYYKNPAMLTR